MSLSPLPRLRTPDPVDGNSTHMTSMDMSDGKYSVAADAFAPKNELQVSPFSLRRDSAGNEEIIGQIRRTVEWHRTEADGKCKTRPCHLVLQFIVPKDCEPPQVGASAVDRITSVGEMIQDFDDLRSQGLINKILSGVR